MIKITIDREACIGASACVAAAGKTFALDAEGKSTVVDTQGDPLDRVLAAEKGCPTGAIQVFTSAEKNPPDTARKI